jgi:hypothetical protein
MKWLFVCFCFFSTFLHAQDSLSWQLQWQLEISPSASWQVDPFGNLFLSEKDQLRKYDSLGHERAVQSSKFLGSISRVDPSNPMKTLLFSEQQQIVTYVDNTLTQQQPNIELGDLELSYVTLVATSSQPDKFWVYDQENSKIILLSTNRQQGQRIENISGLLGTQDIIQLFEQDGFLYLIDRKKGIYQFDTYGTLIFHWGKTDILWTIIEGEYAYLLKENRLEVVNLKTQEVTTIQSPLAGALKFQKIQNTFYFSAKDRIQKFNLILFK